MNFVVSSKNLAQLEDFVVSLGEPKFRAKQLHDWVYGKFAKSFDEMSNISKDFREKLKVSAQISSVKIKQRLISEDGTIKYLLGFEDGCCVETVLMRFDNRSNLTACVSCQVGCAVGCVFCATGQAGFKRNLTAQEIAEQVMTIQRDTGLKVTNVVYMGQGEPMLNLDNVQESIEILNKDLQIGARRMTISTSGIIPGILKLAQSDKQVTLAFSLHAPDSESRAKIMPIENKYNLKEVMNALKIWNEKTGRRITIEYTMIRGVNDSINDAKKIVELLKDVHCNVNIIPYNPTCDDKLQKPTRNDIYKFKYILEEAGKKTTVRLERGADIAAACGQLSGKMD